MGKYLILAVAILLGGQQATFAASITGRVVKVADGDTITILVGTEQHRIRLKGIDAPERKQSFGKASARSLSALVAGEQVRVEYDKRDRYKRIIGAVWVPSHNVPCTHTPCPKTLDASLYQLTIGMAWWYRRFAREQAPEQRGQYEFAETEARARRVGLWQEPHAIAPWEWRKGIRPASDALSPVVGNRKSKVYHVAGCPSYGNVSKPNQVAFQSGVAARDAGYRRARNCP